MWAQIAAPATLRAWGWVVFIVADVGLNTLTGGDPRETLSSSWHKDRKSAWFPALAINIVEWADKESHGPDAENPAVGENSQDNRELPGLWRTGLSLVLLGLVVGCGVAIL